MLRKVSNLSINFGIDSENAMSVSSHPNSNDLIIIKSRDGGLGVVADINSLKEALEDIKQFLINNKREEVNEEE